VADGQRAEIGAELAGVGKLRVTSTPEGATVFLDGEPVGRTPLTREGVPAGSRFVELRLGGFQTFARQVSVAAGQTTPLVAKLADGQAPASQPRTPTQYSSFGGRPLPVGAVMVDAGTGYPYFLEARLTVGALEGRNYGLDVGADFRTYGVMNELAVRARALIYQKKPFALGGEVQIGGGGGPSSRNSFFGRLGVNATVALGQYVQFTGRMHVDLHTDRLCPDQAPPPPGVQSDLRDVCRTHDLTGRLNGARFLLGAVLEVAFKRNFGFFLMIEGAPFQPERAIYRGELIGVLPTGDLQFYGRLGMQFRF
jgi:hypothetical protein